MADVARSHGGDGGNGPPHRNRKRIQTGCESSQPKKTRGKASNKKLYGKFKKNNFQKLSVQVNKEDNQYKFVGGNSSDIIRSISNEIRRIAPFHYRSWQHIPDDKKKEIYTTAYQYFDLDAFDKDEWPGVQLGIQAECQRSYRMHKGKLKLHFDEVGGYEDIEAAKDNPPSDYESDPEKWTNVIDLLFQDPKYKHQSEQNKKNRRKQRYSSYHGTQSYAQKRHMRLPGHENYVEGFKSTHWKEGLGWVNETASSDYKKIQAEVQRMENDSNDSSPIDEIECMRNALGERRGHIRGVGRVVRKPTPEVPSSRQLTPHEYWQQNVDHVIEENIAKQVEEQVQRRVEEQVQRCEEEFHRRVEEQVQRQVNEQMSQMQEAMKSQFTQQLEEMTKAFKRKEQILNRNHRHVLVDRSGDRHGLGDGSGGRKGDGSGGRRGDRSGDDEDD